MGTKLDAMTWMEQQTADLPERGVTELALRILNQIEAEMKRQGVSRSELARRAGRKPSYVSRILNDSGNVTLATIVRLANALDLEIEPPRLRPRAPASELASPKDGDGTGATADRRKESEPAIAP